MGFSQNESDYSTTSIINGLRTVNKTERDITVSLLFGNLTLSCVPTKYKLVKLKSLFCLGLRKLKQ